VFVIVPAALGKVCVGQAVSVALKEERLLDARGVMDTCMGRTTGNGSAIPELYLSSSHLALSAHSLQGNLCPHSAAISQAGRDITRVSGAAHTCPFLVDSNQGYNPRWPHRSGEGRLILRAAVNELGTDPLMSSFLAKQALSRRIPAKVLIFPMLSNRSNPSHPYAGEGTRGHAVYTHQVMLSYPHSTDTHLPPQTQTTICGRCPCTGLFYVCVAGGGLHHAPTHTKTNNTVSLGKGIGLGQQYQTRPRGTALPPPVPPVRAYIPPHLEASLKRRLRKGRDRAWQCLVGRGVSVPRTALYLRGLANQVPTPLDPSPASASPSGTASVSADITDSNPSPSLAAPFGCHLGVVVTQLTLM
ncbi:hypothetical protein KIPB_005523, partial [Kipferlia bialata]